MQTDTLSPPPTFLSLLEVSFFLSSSSSEKIRKERKDHFLYPLFSLPSEAEKTEEDGEKGVRLSQKALQLSSSCSPSIRLSISLVHLSTFLRAASGRGTRNRKERKNDSSIYLPLFFLSVSGFLQVSTQTDRIKKKVSYGRVRRGITSVLKDGPFLSRLKTFSRRLAHTLAPPDTRRERKKNG